MRYFLLGLFLLAGWTTYTRWHYMCKILNKCEDGTAISAIDSTNMPQPRPTDLTIQLDDSTTLENYEHFEFEEGKYIPNLSDNNYALLDALAAYLKEHPNTLLRIIGYYKNNELDSLSGMQEDIGMARAAVVRDFIMEKGIEPNRFLLSSSITDDLRRPVGFEIIQKPPQDYDFEIPQFTFTNMNFEKLTFAYNSAILEPTEAFTTYADSVNTYFNENPDKVLTIVGHTDDVGSTKFNYDLGLKRAKAVKKYFVDLGIPEDKIKTDSKGKTAPVAPNDTEENRQKNRRVNTLIE